MKTKKTVEPTVNIQSSAPLSDLVNDIAQSGHAAAAVRGLVEELGDAELYAVRDFIVQQAYDAEQFTLSEKRPLETKASQLAKWLSEDALKRVQDQGGYPDDVGAFAGCVFVASDRGEGEPDLATYTPDEVAAFHDAIARSMKKHPKEDICFHVGENHPG